MIPLPKFKEFICNNVIVNIFENQNIFEPTLFSNDSSFEILPIHLSTKTKEEQDLYISVLKDQSKIISSLNNNPTEQIVLNNDFGFSINFDSGMINNGISLHSLLKISDSLHTELLFVSGDGHDYQISELTSSHEADIILNIHFISSINSISVNNLALIF
jgi:hypothetical protein